ncbi:hypothetical protein ACPCBF_25080 [Streptomyces pseudogriseolus]|uniref:hypothetical protein n=1 Tax=Streptomyces pseudogriseolus TaxID=36817 RepID=UPI003FA21E0E
MSVSVNPTGPTSAEITWESGDDPRGHLARALQSDQLAHALEVLGDSDSRSDAGPADAALSAAMHTFTLARLLERRATVQVVRLRDDHGLSWGQIASALYDDPERTSSVRRLYDSGRRNLGV